MSLILAVAQLSFGILALKKTNGFALCCGAVMAAAGLLGIQFCRGEWTLLLCLGLIMPAGLGAFSFGIIMGAVTPLLSERRAAITSGIISASSGLGNIIMAPILRGILGSVGLFGAILALCIPAVCMIPMARWFQRFRTPEAMQEKERPMLKTFLAAAFQNRSHRFLVIAFFTCGFHMAIIETHLYTELTSYGLSEQSVTYAFSVYGRHYDHARFCRQQGAGKSILYEMGAVGLLCCPPGFDYRLFVAAENTGIRFRLCCASGVHRRSYRTADLRPDWKAVWPRRIGYAVWAGVLGTSGWQLFQRVAGRSVRRGYRRLCADLVRRCRAVRPCGDAGIQHEDFCFQCATLQVNQ